MIISLDDKALNGISSQVFNLFKDFQNRLTYEFADKRLKADKEGLMLWGKIGENAYWIQFTKKGVNMTQWRNRKFISRTDRIDVDKALYYVQRSVD